jgi:hypothetical protein
MPQGGQQAKTKILRNPQSFSYEVSLRGHATGAKRKEWWILWLTGVFFAIGLVSILNHSIGGRNACVVDRRQEQ